MTPQPLTETTTSLLTLQSGVATIAQLVDSGTSRDRVRAEVHAHRWQRLGERCILTHNFEPTRTQWMWVAVLDHTGPVALAGLTSLETAGFRFFGREAEMIHVVVRRGSRYHRFPQVWIHESRRFSVGDIDPDSVIPRTRLPRSAIDGAAWQPSVRYACGLLAAAVQQKICTAQDLGDELRYVGRVRHKAAMRLAVLDIAGGAEALSELDIAALCRKYGLRPPDRQRIRRDRAGRRRYLDCEWVLDDGTVVVLEVDGSHHAEVEHWQSDVKRERGVVISGSTVLRATANEARHEQAPLAADLAAIGVPRLVRR